MKYLVGAGVIEAAAHLPADIEQVPNGKSFLIREHGRDAIALYVFHRGAELAIDFSRTKNGREVGVAQDLGGLCLFEEAFLQCGGAFAEGGQLNRLQSDSLASLRVGRLVNRAGGRFCQFTQNFEVADFRGHCFVPHPG